MSDQFTRAEEIEAGNRIISYESIRHLGVRSKHVAERTYDGRDHVWVQDRTDGKWLFWASKPHFDRKEPLYFEGSDSIAAHDRMMERMKKAEEIHFIDGIAEVTSDQAELLQDHPRNRSRNILT